MAQTIKNAQAAAEDIGLGKSFGKILTRATLLLIKAKGGSVDVNQLRLELLDLVKDVESYTGTMFYGQDVIEAVLSFEVPEQVEALIKKVLVGLKAGGEELYNHALGLAKKIMAALKSLAARESAGGAQAALFTTFTKNQKFQSFLFLILVLAVALALKFLRVSKARSGVAGTETVFEDLEQRLSLETLQEGSMDEAKMVFLLSSITYLTIGVLLVAKSKKKPVQLLGAFFCLEALLSLGVVLFGKEEKMLELLKSMMAKISQKITR